MYIEYTHLISTVQTKTKNRALRRASCDRPVVGFDFSRLKQINYALMGKAVDGKR